MATITWVDYSNGDTLLDIRNGINTFNSSVTSQVNSNTSSIATNSSNIATNSSNIATNTSAIATNTSAIATNTSAIAAINSKTFDYTTGSSITVPNDVYSSIATLLTPSRVAGTYKLEQSMLYSLNSTTTSAYFRFTLDGGATWTEIRREPKDNTDLIPQSFSTIIVHTGGVIDIQIEARKENAADTLVVHNIDIILERKV